jgi:hypothetical protein
MVGDEDDIRLLLAGLSRQLTALREAPEMTAEPDGSRGSALREHVADLLAAVECRIAGRPPKDAHTRAQSAYARQLRQSVGMLRAAHIAIPWVSATQRPNINLGSLYLAEALAQMLVGSKVDLIVVPDQEFMYSTTSWPFSDFIEEIELTTSFRAKTERRPIILNYPLTDADRLLLHPNLAHELGHAAVEAHDLVAEAGSRLRNEATHQASAMQQAWNAWVEELLCDHLAIETMGPAYLLSLAAFVLPTSYHDAWPTHPPNTLRLRLALEHLRARKWDECMLAVAPSIASFLEGIGAEGRTLLLPGDFARMHQELQDAGSVLQEIAGERVGKAALDPAVCKEEAIEAATLLKKRILPVGLEGPLEPRSILIGGWRAAVEAHGDEPTTLATALEDTQLQELIGKAVELSIVTSAWMNR